MNFKDLRQNLDEAQIANLQQIRRLARGGGVRSKSQASAAAALQTAMAQLQRAGGDINKVQPKHRKVLGDFSSTILGAVVSSPTAMNAALRNLRTEEFESIDDMVIEAANMPHDPPMVMVLKRKGIRIFPDGKKVALYTNDQLGLTFTVPYVGGETSNQNVMTGVQEEVDYGDEMLNENIKRLRFASSKKGTPVSINFKTGDSTKVDPITARAITSLHSKLSAENKITLVDKISNDPEAFKHVASFAHRYITHKPEEPKQPAAQPTQPVKKGKPVKK